MDLMEKLWNTCKARKQEMGCHSKNAESVGRTEPEAEVEGRASSGGRTPLQQLKESNSDQAGWKQCSKNNHRLSSADVITWEQAQTDRMGICLRQNENGTPKPACTGFLCTVKLAITTEAGILKWEGKNVLQYLQNGSLMTTSKWRKYLGL